MLKLVFLLLPCCWILSASPVRKPVTTYTQPDGSEFEVRLKGDEWARIQTTSDGCAFVRDADGWYCYARFDPDGTRHSTGVHVGSPASQAVRAASRSIPADALRAHAAMRRSQMRAYARPAAKAVSKAGEDSPVEMRGLIVLAQFSDVKFTSTREMFVDMLTKRGYSYNGATGCVEEYFEDQVGSAYRISFDVSQIVTLSQPRSYYAANDDNGDDIRPAEAVAESCRLAHDAAEGPVDFSLYDSDADGYVDNVFLFAAGGDEADGAGDDCFWSHSWNLKSAGINLRLDGKTISDYALSTELADISGARRYKGTFTGIGTFCHEFSHILGLPDLYDTDYEDSGGKADALWMTTALMDGGNTNNNCNTPPNYNAVDLDVLGLGTCETITTGSYTLQPISREKRYIRINTDNSEEYYLLECRDNSGWDAYIKGKGLAVYHIDKSTRHTGVSDYYKRNLTAYQRWFVYNEVNCRPDHQCADMIEACPKATGAKGVFFPYETVNSLNPDTHPDLKYWSGAAPQLSINGITLNADGSVSFSVGASIRITDATPWQDAVRLSWESDARICSVSIAGKSVVENVRPWETGKFACTVEGLAPSTEYTIDVTGGGASGSVTVKTKSYYASSHPFIYLGNAVRDEEGAFKSGTKIPLHVYNAPDAVETEWFFGGRSAATGNDGLFKITSSGILTAKVYHPDGSIDIIRKEIVVR